MITMLVGECQTCGATERIYLDPAGSPMCIVCAHRRWEAR